MCHAADEYARDEDSDGFCEVHVNTIEGLVVAASVAPTASRYIPGEAALLPGPLLSCVECMPTGQSPAQATPAGDNGTT